jgi:hypothetical protein
MNMFRRNHQIILMYFLLVFILLISTTRSDEPPVLRRKKKRQSSDSVVLDLKYMPALMKTSLWADDIRIKLSIPGSQTPVCEVKMAHAVDGQFPCHIDKAKLKSGFNRFDVTVFSQNSGRVLSKTKTTFHVDNEDEEPHTMFKRLKGSVESFVELFDEEMRAMLSLGGMACLLGVFGMPLGRFLTTAVGEQLATLSLDDDEDDENESSGSGGSSGSPTSILYKLGAKGKKIPKMLFTSFGRSGATATTMNSGSTQTTIVADHGTATATMSRHNDPNESKLRRANSLKTIFGLSLGYYLIFHTSAKHALVKIGVSLVERAVERVRAPLILMRKAASGVGEMTTKLRKRRQQGSRPHAGTASESSSPTVTKGKAATAAATEAITVIGPFIPIPNYYSAESSQSPPSRSATPPTRTSVEEAASKTNLFSPRLNDFNPPSSPFTTTKTTTTRYKGRETTSSPTAVITSTSTSTSQVALLVQSRRPRVQVDLSRMITQAQAIGEAKKQQLLMHLQDWKARLLQLRDGQVGVGRPHFPAIRIGAKGGPLSPAKIWRTLLAVAVEAVIVAVKLSTRKPYHQALGALDRHHYLGAQLPYILRRR